MKSLERIFSEKDQTLSFEFFPPIREKTKHILEDTMKALAPFGPDFISVTDRKQGAYRTDAIQTCATFSDTTSIPSMAHLTCHALDASTLSHHLTAMHDEGIDAVMALRGDIPKKSRATFDATSTYTYANELIEAIKKDGRFTIGCAAYPDGHPEATAKQEDWDRLRQKFDAGADFAITQLFFDNDAYTEMRDYLGSHGAEQRIIPGILPLTNLETITKTCKACQVTLPTSLARLIEKYEGNPVDGRKAGIEYSINQCDDLLEFVEAPGLHIYSMNRSTAPAELVTGLRLLGTPI